MVIIPIHLLHKTESPKEWYVCVKVTAKVIAKHSTTARTISNLGLNVLLFRALMHLLWIFLSFGLFLSIRVIHISINKLKREKQTEEEILFMFSPPQNNTHEPSTYINLSQGCLPTPGDIWPFLETFLVIHRSERGRWGVLLESSE